MSRKHQLVGAREKEEKETCSEEGCATSKEQYQSALSVPARDQCRLDRQVTILFSPDVGATTKRT